jgi:CcmD family protein
MNKSAFRRLLFLPLLLTTATAMAQQAATTDVSMADQLRADGKIWVVVGVIALVFAGIIVYLVRLDGQISKLEKDLKSDKTVKTNA